jgi:dolichyl-phosphate beta-glucosyltransferase
LKTPTPSRHGRQLLIPGAATANSPSLPSTITKDLPRLVILIPAYNEEDRIQSTLNCYQDFLMNHCSFSPLVEILVVDDGSPDSTYDVVLRNKESASNKIPVDCIRLSSNRGKGAALSAGIQEIISNNLSNNNHDLPPLILTQDADGSGDLKYLHPMLEILSNILTNNTSNNDDNIWSYRGMVVGNRNYNFFTPRGVTRWGFQTVVRLLMNNLPVQDSQCGYKLMTLSAAEALYKDLHLQGWSHDVEVLYRAKLLDVPIAEISIDWEDKDGSKVVSSGVAKVSLQMLLDVLQLRWNYSITKAWTL